MKYFIFSIDDGTIYDKKVVNILNSYHIHATFNLNSGLQDFIWYKDNKPVERLDLLANKDIYQGHEVASHSLTHPYMTMCPDEAIYHEVADDISNLKDIFNRSITTFAFPFEDYDERCINIIKNIYPISIIRVSQIDTSFRFPSDPYHIKITSWDVDDALSRVVDFINDDNAELFVFVAHSYDFEFANSYGKLKKLCQIITGDKNIKIITMKELNDIRL